MLACDGRVHEADDIADSNTTPSLANASMRGEIVRVAPYVPRASARTVSRIRSSTLGAVDEGAAVNGGALRRQLSAAATPRPTAMQAAMIVAPRVTYGEARAALRATITPTPHARMTTDRRPSEVTGMRPSKTTSAVKAHTASRAVFRSLNTRESSRAGTAGAAKRSR